MYPYCLIYLLPMSAGAGVLGLMGRGHMAGCPRQLMGWVFIVYMFKPEKHMKAMAISPTVMNVMPNPRRGAGTSE